MRSPKSCAAMASRSSLGEHATAARRDGEDFVVVLESGREVRGDRLLVATGRTPRVEGIGLETVGITADRHGIPVDAQMRAGERLWALGDVTGIWPLTHVGKYQGEIVAANILGEPRDADYRAVPRISYTDPQAAAVGATEARFSATVPVSELAKTETYTRAYAQSNGFLTLLSDGEVLTGAYALGPEAGEWLQQATLAIRARVPLDVLRDTIQPFPTFSEIYVGALKALREAIASEPGMSAELLGQTVVVIGGSAGIGLETARRARAEGADVVLTARNPERLEQAALEVGARSSTAFDATDFDRLDAFFDELPTPIDHVMLTAGRPYYAPLATMDFDEARRDVDAHLWLALRVARHAMSKVRPGGTLLFVSGTGGRRPTVGLSIVAALTAGMPALAKGLALELAPVRVNVIAPGFVDTPLSASLLGDQLEERREQLRATLPIGRVVGPEDVAALAVHIMTNTALTGATFDIDGGQQLVAG